MKSDAQSLSSSFRNPTSKSLPGDKTAQWHLYPAVQQKIPESRTSLPGKILIHPSRRPQRLAL